MTVTGDPTQNHALVLHIPLIYWHHKKAFTDAPGVWQGGDERGIYHIPDFSVVLHFLTNHTINMSHTLPHRITSEFGENIRHGYMIALAGFLNIADNFVDHELII